MKTYKYTVFVPVEETAGVGIELGLVMVELGKVRVKTSKASVKPLGESVVLTVSCGAKVAEPVVFAPFAKGRKMNVT